MVLPEVSQFTSAGCLFAFGNGTSCIRIGGYGESEVYVHVCYLLLKFVTLLFLSTPSLAYYKIGASLMSPTREGSNWHTYKWKFYASRKGLDEEDVFSKCHRKFLVIHLRKSRNQQKSCEWKSKKQLRQENVVKACNTI